MKDFIAHTNEAFANLLSAKLRSFLAILGVLVGTASVVALVSGGQLATEHALEQFKAMGTDLLAVSISATQSSDTPPEEIQQSGGKQPAAITLNDLNKFQQANPFIVASAPYTSDYSTIAYNGKKIEGEIIGATPALKNVTKIELDQGRFITVVDNYWYAFNCVIGKKIAQKLHEQGVLFPIGQQIQVGKRYCLIIGTMKQWPENIFMYADLNNAIILPLDSAKILNKYTKIRNIVFKIDPNMKAQVAQDKLTKSAETLLPGNRFFFRSAEQIISGMEKQQRTFTGLLALIGSISLLVGGIGVMNIMLVSVVERRREIGIRMAIGARGKDIQRMFLIESVALTLFGGIIGVIVGITISAFIALISGWQFHFFILPPLIGFLVSVLVGIFFGFYPALQAARLDPIQTLRGD